MLACKRTKRNEIKIAENPSLKGGFKYYLKIQFNMWTDLTIGAQLFPDKTLNSFTGITSKINK